MPLQGKSGTRGLAPRFVEEQKPRSRCRRLGISRRRRRPRRCLALAEQPTAVVERCDASQPALGCPGEEEVDSQMGCAETLTVAAISLLVEA